MFVFMKIYNNFVKTNKNNNMISSNIININVLPVSLINVVVIIIGYC